MKDSSRWRALPLGHLYTTGLFAITVSLQSKLDKLCHEIDVPIPQADITGGYVLAFSRHLQVRIMEDKAHHVFITQGFARPERHDIYWDRIRGAMQKSYAWHGLATSVCLDSEDHLAVQSLVNEDTPYAVFFDILNHHCAFCDALLQHMAEPLTTTVDHYDVIRP